MKFKTLIINNLIMELLKQIHASYKFTTTLTQHHSYLNS